MFKLWLFVFLMISALILVGCDAATTAEEEAAAETETPASTTTTPVLATIISGTAASGLPIVGIVNVKGANGNTASADIDVNGDYELDVANLTAPYVLRAEGTVNGKSIELYSTGVAAGNINITPITNLITSQVIANLDDAFENWSTVSTTVNEAAIQAAETTVQTQLAPILEAYGITGDIDLMSMEFDTDHSGLDGVLDAIEVTIDDSNNVTITNTATGTQITGDEVFTDDEGTALVQVISETAAMNVFFTTLTSLFATELPSASELNTTIAPLIADDYIDSGRTKTDWLDNLATGDALPIGITVEIAIDRPMESSEFSSDYEKGYWLKLFYEIDGNKGVNDSPLSMVYDGTNWLFYGSREWIDFWFVNEAIQYFHYSSESGDYVASYGSTMHFNINDNYNYAYDQGIRYALVHGPGLVEGSEGGYLGQMHGFPDDEFNNCCLDITSDAMALAIPENPEYDIWLFETNEFSTETAKQSYKRTIAGKPFLPSELSAEMFPVITQPSSHDVSDLSIGGDVTIAWNNHAECKVNWMELRWCEGETCLSVKKAINDGSESTTLDTSTNNLGSITWANLGFECKDLDGRIRSIGWNMHSSGYTGDAAEVVDVPTADITIDGSVDDWSGIAAAYQDDVNDNTGNINTDLTDLYIAKSGDDFAIRFDVQGTITFPHTPENSSSHYEVGIHLYNGPCSDETDLDRYFIVNHYAFSSSVDHSINFYPEGTTSPTNIAYSGSSLEIGFPLSEFASDVTHFTLNPYIQSFTGNASDETRVTHDSSDSDVCFKL